jgi:hypothetical protein
MRISVSGEVLLIVLVLLKEGKAIVIESTGELESDLFKGFGRLLAHFLHGKLNVRVFDQIYSYLDRPIEILGLLPIVLLLCMDACNIVIADGKILIILCLAMVTPATLDPITRSSLPFE